MVRIKIEQDHIRMEIAKNTQCVAPVACLADHLELFMTLDQRSCGFADQPKTGN
jgi:hypothetical protein